jgi:VWFA-related protein
MSRLACRTGSGVSAFLAAASAACLVFAAAPTALAQSGTAAANQASPPSNVPTIKVTSRETVVDVTVTDAKGNPVHGLKQSDFTVEEDGKPQPIRGFYEFDKTTHPAPARTLPPNTYTNARTLPASGPVQILYFDLPYGCSYPPGTDPVADTAEGTPFVRAKKYIADYLRTMPAGTQAAVFVYRADYGLRMLQGFTTDGPRAATAVDNLVVLSVGPAPKADPIAAADQVAAYVAGIHGRKNLIWISTTPLAIMRDGGLSWSVGAAPDMTYVHRLMDTYDTFTREQIAVYPFDPQGVPVGGHALGLGNLRSEDIATETGGAAIYNTNDFKGAVAKIVNDTLHFYTLSYVPTRPESDGHFHPISIKVNRPGLHLVYRGGYNDEQPSPPDDVLKVHMSQNSMGLGALLSTQLQFDVRVEPSTEPENPWDPPVMGALNSKLKRARLARYGFLFTLPPSQIAFADAGGGTYSGSVEFDVAAFDSDGNLVTILSQTQKLPLTNEEYGEFIATPFQFFQQIDLPPGQFTLRVGVFDTVSNKIGTLELPLTVGKKPPTPAVVSEGKASK